MKRNVPSEACFIMEIYAFWINLVAVYVWKAYDAKGINY